METLQVSDRAGRNDDSCCSISSWQMESHKVLAVFVVCVIVDSSGVESFGSVDVCLIVDGFRGGEV